MKKYVALTLLVLTAVGVVASHLEVERHDDSYVLNVDGVRFDVLGHANDQLIRATRRCANVNQQLTNDPMAEAVKTALRAYSLPDSQRLVLRQLSSSGSWFLAEVEFSDLQSAVVLLENGENGFTINNGSVWSGPVDPWVAGPWIRRYLLKRAPQVPSDLWACFDPSPRLFGPH